MIYRKFGKTGVMVSALGFGTMRMPQYQKGEDWFVDDEKAIPLLERAYELGINYFDTAYGYNNGKGEFTVGKAIRKFRDKVYLSTKLPMWYVEKREDYRRILEEQLIKLDTGHIDFYHFHAVNKDVFDNRIIKFSLMEEARRAKEEGLIRHISFSFHDKPEVLKEIVDTGFFETLLCQYNLIDRGNEDAMAYAAQKGVGVAVMGPVAGGRLSGPSEVLEKHTGGRKMKAAETALRFVFSNPNISCVLSGMQDIGMLEENVRIASDEKLLSGQENEDIKSLYEKTGKIADLYCTGCEYCLPCDEGIRIPDIFRMLINHEVYGLRDLARNEYEALLKSDDPNNQMRHM